MDKSKPSKKRRRLNANSRRWQFAKQYFNSDLNLIWLNGNQQKKIKGKGVLKIRLDYDPVRKVYHNTNNVPINDIIIPSPAIAIGNKIGPIPPKESSIDPPISIIT